MRKRTRNHQKSHNSGCFLDIYTIANIFAYSACFTFLIAAGQNNKLNQEDLNKVIVGVFVSIFAAMNHSSKFIQNCDALIRKININLCGITIDHNTIGATYSMVNSGTKSLVGLMATTALTPVMTDFASKVHPRTPEFVLSSVGMASAAALATTLVHALTHCENTYFGIKNNGFRIGSAGSSQIAFIERLTFNTTLGYLPQGRIPSYIAACLSGFSELILCSAYRTAGLELNIDPTKPIYKDSSQKMLGNMASRLSKMACERYISRT